MLKGLRAATGNVMNAKRSVVLDVSGQRLSLRTDKDEAFLKTLAGYVGGQVDALMAAAPGVTRDKICLLVALQLADELFTERENVKSLQGEIEARSQRLLKILDKELGETEEEHSWSHAQSGQESLLRRP
jgi:cell division protein ZapA